MNIIRRLIASALALAVIFTALSFPASAETEPEKKSSLRREISPEQPMWIVHIDTWVNADPAKVIDVIPEDILPYVVFNISLSVGWDEEEMKFTRAEYGYEVAKSWLRTCAEKGVWAMIQPASGGPSHFPDYDPAEIDYDDTIFGEFFRDYPNFLGFNYCEQFWGFENYVKGFPITAEERYKHFAGLLELCNKYGGYLVDSWCGNEWSPSINPLAMIKRIPEFEEAARKYSDNFILLEKYTQLGYLFDMESLVLGTYLSGYCGNFGIRYDSSGWTDESGESNTGYLLSTGLTVQLERMILNGATVIDGPELAFTDDIVEIETATDKKGFSIRQWDSTPQFENVCMDMFRKVIEGSFRIPSREEVIDRIGLILINDVESGTDDKKYSIPPTLTEGLYKMDYDGNLKDNHSFYKKTGRYPTIPTSAGFADEKYEKMFRKIVYTTEYDDVWGDVDKKVAEFNEMFPEEYTGDLYAGRFENTWITYNPYKNSTVAKGVIPLKYNTADAISLDYSRYTTGIVREYADEIDVYLNNFDDKSMLILSTDVIKISGASKEPELKITNRGVGTMEPQITEDYSGGVYTLTVKHNGPVDLAISCSGSGTGKLTEYTDASIKAPDFPPEYSGTQQYEAELFDTLDVEALVKNGSSGKIRDYLGQGYLCMGIHEGAKARDTVTAKTSGTYTLSLRYRAGGGSAQLYVNGKKNDLALEDTSEGWTTQVLTVKLKKGENTVELRMPEELPSKLYIDCFTVDLISAGGGFPIWAIALIAGGVIIAAAVIAAVIVLKPKKQDEKS